MNEEHGTRPPEPSLTDTVPETVGKHRHTDGPVILLVDDEPEILTALRRCLRRDGYQFVTAQTASQALERLTDGEVDLVITDEKMPEMKGTELLAAIRDRSPLTPCAILTGVRSPTVIREGGRAGAVTILFKPWDEQVLRKTVRRLLRPGTED